VKKIVAVVFLFVLALCPANAQQKRDSLVLVVNRAPKSLSVFKVDRATLSLVKKLPLGDEAREICLAPDGTRAYVSNINSKSVTVVDLEKLEVVSTIGGPEFDRPDGGVVSADSKTLYVTQPFKNAIAVIDAATYRLIKMIPTTGVGPRRLLLARDGKVLYVGFNKGDAIGVVDLAAGKQVGSIKVGDEPRGGLAFSPDGKLLLAGTVEGDTVAVIDVASGAVQRIFGVPFSPQRIEMTPRGEALVLSGGQGHSLTIVGNFYSHDKTKALPVGTAAWGLAVNEDGTIAYSSNYGDGTLTIIDVPNQKVLQTVDVGQDPNGVAYRRASQ
jgi:YVTN family beta-propeller protein